MLRRAWKPLATTLLIGTPAYIYYKSKREQQSFSINVRERGPDGKVSMSPKTFPLLSLAALEERIKGNATSETHVRPNGLVWNHTTAYLPSNDPIEDANSSQIIQRDPSDPLAPGDYLFFSVMDGHSGTQTSQLLSRVLINAVALELSQLDKKQDPPKCGYWGSLRSLIWSPKTPSLIVESGPQRVAAAIQNAFTKLDAELLNAPLHILANNIDDESRKNKTIPDLSHHPLALASMLPAVSGSCAIMAVIDTANQDLYVACTGDSRAVAGVWLPTSDGKGQWRIEALSEDQTGRNPNEKRRLQSEHPPDEADYVVREGRILGGLEPSRAFGDARYKWPLPIQETLNTAFMVGNNKPLRPPPPLFKTPPYVTATPVVTHRKMDFSSGGNPSSTDGAVRFIVLATDGLWDELTNEEVVNLVAGRFAGLKGKIPRAELPNFVSTTQGSPGVEGKRKKDMKTEGHWAFEDENMSAHLIRNAFGGGDEFALRRRLSIPAPYSRRYRDDVTVTVVWWEEGNKNNVKVSSVTEKAKAKL
ncbi:hypothetical protein AMATHDRAFT_142830 [Amanita thiersii Skay4041]|uniref:PPM-type phosphatase domain-containing protein n=1 Tax=Amanita thiersii Skay4041 TaxID=703135 RepID=A0A2A9NPQ1_9AGAR|nr:hypothetical protein AMATHDRAFT_142830 [Amanita thiersii Skay4041]